MASSLGFGSYACYLFFRAIHTRFRCGSGLSTLAMRSTHKLAGSFFNRHAVEDLRPLPLIVDIWFQIYFTPLPGFFSPFPRGTSPLSVSWEYLALGEWSSRVHAGFHGSDVTQADPQGSSAFRLRDYHPLWSPVPVTLLAVRLGFACNLAPSCTAGTESLTTPHEQRMQPITHMRFGLFPVRSPLLGESLV